MTQLFDIQVKVKCTNTSGAELHGVVTARVPIDIREARYPIPDEWDVIVGVPDYPRDCDFETLEATEAISISLVPKI